MASAKPSFLQAYQPPPGSEQDRVLLLQDAPSANNNNASTSSIGNNGLNGPPSSSNRASHGRSHGYKRRKQWQAADSSGVDGLVFYSLAAAVACGFGMFYAWKWWQKHQRSRATRQPRQQQPHASHSGQGSRSAFSFDKPGKGGKGKKGQGSASQGPPVVKTPPIPPASQLRQEPLRAGNAKKDKALRRERKADKQARKQAAKEQAEQVKLAGERAAEATGKDDPAVVTYIDYDRTSEAFQRVKDWQETGKKRYD